MYLTYAEYVTKTLDPVTEVQFNVLEPEAELMIDSWTFCRLTKYETIPDNVKYCLVKMIEALYLMYQDSKKLREGQSVKSYSNGVSSWSFDTPFTGNVQDYETAVKVSMYQMVIDVLPVELVSAVIPGGCGCM